MTHWQDSKLEPTAWASNSGEEKDSLNHMPQAIKKNQRLNRVLYKKTSRSHGKILKRFELATFTSAVWKANHSATET